MPKRQSFEIGGEHIAPGTRRTVDIPVSVLADHTPVSLSAHVIHGKRTGPTVFVSAGIHGDEVIGIEICRRLLTLPNLDKLRGTLIVVPVVNAFGLLTHSRYLPDRRDLNRCFPGSETGSLASRLAHIFMQEIVHRCDLGVDLHSAARHRTNLPQVRISPGNADTARLARIFGAPVVLTSNLRDGSLRGEAKEKAGVDVLLFEAGEALRFDEYSARAGVMGILRVLHDQKMIAAKGIAKAKAAPLFCETSRWLRATQGGLIRVYKSEGDVVAAGDLLAAISDPFGEVEHEITAPDDGVIVGRTVSPIVNEGDALFHIARVRVEDNPEATVGELTAQLEGETLFDEDEII